MNEKPEVVTAVWSPEWKKKNLEWNHSLLQSSVTGDGDKLRILNFLFFSASPYSLPRLAQHVLEGRSIFFENIGIRADRNDEYVLLVNELSNEKQRIGKGILLRLIANVADDFLQRQDESKEWPDEPSEDSDSDCSTEDVNSTILEMKDRINNAYKVPPLRSIALENVLKVDEQSGYSVLQAAVVEGDDGKVGHIVPFCLDPEIKLEDYQVGQNAGLTLPQLVMTFESEEFRVVSTAIKELTETKSNMSSLQNAVCANNVEKVIQLVCEENQDVNDPGVIGVPPLILAAAVGNLEMVQTLMDLGVKVDSPPSKTLTSIFKYRGETALMTAINFNKPSTIRILLNHGADVNATAL